MSDIHGVRWIDTDGTVRGFKNVDGNPRVLSQSYYDQIAEGNVTGHSSWSKIGYTPTMTTTESDLWSAAGVYVFPTAAAGMEVVSSNNTADIGTSIKTGTSTGGSTTTLIDSGANFNAATAVAAGDCVLLDKSGTTPEWGYVTSVDSNTQITCSGGFSSGGSGSSRAYAIVDYSAYTGAHVVRVQYLDGSYAQKEEMIILNGTGVVATVNTDLFRVNSFRVIAAGSGNKPTGNISIRNLADTPVYSYITAGFTRARNIQYTVPSGKTLYVNRLNLSYGYSSNSTHYCRLYTRANRESATGFLTGNIFYPYTETIVANTAQIIDLPIPTKLVAKTDIKVSGIATIAGVAYVALRGWIE